MKLRNVIKAGWLGLAWLLLAGVAKAEPSGDWEEARLRMAERMAVVDRLKLEGKAGEDYIGMLVARDRGAETVAVVREENEDRRLVYRQIASRTGATVNRVQLARGRHIAAWSVHGVWLQRESGEWYRR